MFIILGRKTIVSICYFCVLIIVVGCLYWTTQVSATNIPAQTFCVVLDAGHGGIDGGVQGKTGVYERDINLVITNKVENLLKTLNINVIQTRQTEDGLYGVFASGFKMRDMKARKAIIEQANANLVVSVHMNYFSDRSVRGAQVYYKPDNEVSEQLAEDMQELFVNNLQNARKSCTEGDFYILTCTDTAGILVEGGYLSNAEEEALLLSEEYQDLLAYQIFCGIVHYFDLAITDSNNKI